MKKTILILAFIVAGATVSTNAQMDHGKMAPTQITVNSKIRNGAKYQELNKAMRELWSAHMYWTLRWGSLLLEFPSDWNTRLLRPGHSSLRGQRTLTVG